MEYSEDEFNKLKEKFSKGSKWHYISIPNSIVQVIGITPYRGYEPYVIFEVKKPVGLRLKSRLDILQLILFPSNT